MNIQIIVRGECVCMCERICVCVSESVFIYDIARVYMWNETAKGADESLITMGTKVAADA